MKSDTNSATGLDPQTLLATRWLNACALLLLLVGFALRVAPLFNVGERIFWQYPTEDGYLMLTVSRNLAIGHGLSVSGGTVPTNGIQPLAGLIFAAVFWLVGGDRLLGVAGAQVIEIGLGALMAFLLVKLGELVFGTKAISRAIVRAAAAAWFASPVSLPHTMNCLETALYGCSVLAVVLLVARGSHVAGAWSTKSLIALGAAFGVAFWSRNDAVFLGAAFFVAHVAYNQQAPRLRRVIEVAGVGATAGLIGLPWLAFNYLGFGSVVPISGQSESLVITAGANLKKMPSTLAEYLGVALPIPNSLVYQPAIIVLSVLVTLGVGGALISQVYRKGTPEARKLIAFVGTYVALLVLYYGTYFGTPHFLERYLFPMSPFTALLWVAAAHAALSRFGARQFRILGTGVFAVCTVVAIALGYRVYAHGDDHQHDQVVHWVEQNLEETTWVGAIQTGTLGFFHDRTINLDGKVNPEALAARKADRVQQYALDKGIEFIVDWSGFAGWAEHPVLKPQMDLIVHDEQLDLAVLKRKGSRTRSEAKKTQ